MDTEAIATPADEAQPVNELEVIYLELLANGTFDRLEDLEEADWAALAEEELIGYHFSRHPFLY